MFDLSQISQNLLDNLAFVLLWAVLTGLAVILIWVFVPRLIHRFLGLLGDFLPEDLPFIERRADRFIVAIASLTLVAIGVALIVASASGNVAATQNVALSVGKIVGVWLLTQAPTIVLIAVLGLIGQKFVSRVVPRLVSFQVRANAGSQLEGEIEKNVTTLSNVLTKALSIGIFSVVIFMIMGQLGINLAPLLVAAGVVGIAVGFGAQNLVRDVFSGIFIILENQYRVGDVVNVAGIGGLVEDINLRRTVLRDLDYRQHYIPNGEIRTASNFTKDKSRVNIDIGVAYKEDLNRVIAVLNEVGQSLAQDPEWGPLILDPIKVLRVDNFGDSAIEIKVLGETLPIRQWDVAGQYRLRVKQAFDEHGIEIPFPHRTLYWGVDEPNVLAMRSVVEQAQNAYEPRKSPAPHGEADQSVPNMSPNPDPDANSS